MNTQSYYVSVSEAIRAGRMNLRYIPLTLIISTGLVYTILFLKNFFLPAAHGNQGDHFPQQIFSLFLIPFSGFILAFVWRSVHSVAWKIWALENVQDVHRLYQIAINKGMIYERDSWLNKLEYKTAEQREQLADLETRLDQPRQMEGPAGSGLGGEQTFGYSLKRALLQLWIFLPFFVVVYLMNGTFQFFPFGFFLIFIGGFLLVKWLPRMGKPAPIRFDDSGLTIQKNPPMAWLDITNLSVETRPQGKNSVKMLVIETRGQPKNIELNIDDLEGGNDEIEQTLYDYWVRGMKPSK
ncbi:MAG: hypothetical protein ABIQ93_01930 [Saprospiraceae bacterium]